MIKAVSANDLNEAWYAVMKCCFDERFAKKQRVQYGSFVGHDRYQLHALILEIYFPWTRPLAPVVPEGMRAPVDNDQIETYFAEYIMNPEKAPNEEYSYGEFIYPHVDKIIKMLKKTPHTNQAVINIGNSIEYSALVRGEHFEGWAKHPKIYENPPCLRCITWQYNEEEDNLDIHTFWRSWDVYSGLPTNLGGLQLLNEYVADNIGRAPGKIFAFSSGAHVYDFAKPMVEDRYRTKLEW